MSTPGETDILTIANCNALLGIPLDEDHSREVLGKLIDWNARDWADWPKTKKRMVVLASSRCLNHPSYVTRMEKVLAVCEEYFK